MNNFKTPKDVLDAYFNQIVFDSDDLDSLKKQIRTRLTWAYEAGKEDGTTDGLVAAQEAITTYMESR